MKKLTKSKTKIVKNTTEILSINELIQIRGGKKQFQRNGTTKESDID